MGVQPLLYSFLPYRQLGKGPEVFFFKKKKREKKKERERNTIHVLSK